MVSSLLIDVPRAVERSVNRPARISASSGTSSPVVENVTDGTEVVIVVDILASKVNGAGKAVCIGYYNHPAANSLSAICNDRGISCGDVRQA